MNYKVIVENEHDVTALVEKITLNDSLSQIAYHANITLIRESNSKLPSLSPGMEVRISGVPYQKSNLAPMLHPGVIWEVDSQGSGTRNVSLAVYDRTIYLSKSEDEYLFPKGQSATQRLRKYAKDWSIALDPNLSDTSEKLGKSVYRARTLYSMIASDLYETVKAGGDMYHPRMTNNGLQLYKIGSNEIVHELSDFINLNQNRTLEGAVTRVKVLSPLEPVGDEASPVLAVLSKYTEELGTLQKLVQDEKTKTSLAAKKLAASYLNGIQQSFTVTLPDINTIRAGDAVHLLGMKLIVVSLSRQLGEPGVLNLELASSDFVKRRFYIGY